MHRQSGGEIPQPPPGKTVWPWTKEKGEMPETMHDGSAWPRISIVTPSYNQGQFIEETIRSVLLQGYPNLEYIIIDGGSTDESLDIIKQYEPWLAYCVSEKDRGQADAINKGLERATGTIFNWLNSDDYLEPGGLFKVAEAYRQQRGALAWVGACRLISISGDLATVVFPNGLERDHLGHNWNGRNFYQPSCFLSLDHVRALDGLDPNLHYCLDLDLYLRLLEKGAFAIGEGVWSTAIIHPGAKTQKSLDQSYLEVIKLQKKYGFHEGAENRYQRRFGRGRSEYVIPPKVKDKLVQARAREKGILWFAAKTSSFYKRKNICFVGDFTKSNIKKSVRHFIDAIFPKIVARNPHIKFHIFTRNSKKYSNVYKNKDVKIIGEVKDIAKGLSKYKLFVYPLIDNEGDSQGFKIAAKVGLPIVTSSPGAKGFPVRDGEECFIADDPWEFAEKCNHCLSDPPSWGAFSAKLQIMMSQRSSTATSRNIKAKRNYAYGKRGRIVVIQGGFPAISATFILDQMIGLLDRGYQIENWALYDPKERLIHSEIKKYGLLEKTRYIKIPNSLFRINPRMWMKRFLHVNNIDNLKEIDAFHVNYGANFNLLQPIFRCSNNFVLVSFHGYDASRYTKAKGEGCYDYLFSRADLITTPTNYMRSILLDTGCPSEKIKVHRYGLHLDFFLPKQGDNKNDQIILLTVARLVEKKGIEYTLKAVSKVKEEYNLQYRIVGDGPLRNELEKLARQVGLENEVELLGPLDKQGVLQQMSEADIFVLTSVTAKDGDQEGLPVSLIEAQAMGLPVVSSYHSGIPELVVHGKTGFLAEERDIEKIAEYLDTLIQNPRLREEFGQNARKKVEKEFDIILLNKELADFFSQNIKQTEKKVF